MPRNFIRRFGGWQKPVARRFGQVSKKRTHRRTGKTEPKIKSQGKFRRKLPSERLSQNQPTKYVLTILPNLNCCPWKGLLRRNEKALRCWSLEAPGKLFPRAKRVRQYLAGKLRR